MHITYVPRNTLFSVILVKFYENNHENIVKNSPAFSCAEHCVTPTNYQCQLETIEACVNKLQELE
jgi:hypothetical protein